jgi:hypothetical protein
MRLKGLIATIAAALAAILSWITGRCGSSAELHATVEAKVGPTRP